jgi:hypothetical protein
MSFSLVAPEQFTARQQQYLEKFRRSIDLVSSQAGAIVGAKDVDSRHLIATDSYARIVGLSKGGDVTGRFDREMPCEGTAQFGVRRRCAIGSSSLACIEKCPRHSLIM